MLVTSDDTEQMGLVLFTDLVDSTQLYAEAGDVVAHSFWVRHDQAGRDLIRRWRGLEVGRTDGFLVLFERAGDGLGFAHDYHLMLAGCRPPIRARVGAHWGAMVLRQNSPTDVSAGATQFEIDGLAVPTAARVMSAARGGQTLFSAVAAAALEADVPVHEYVSHGHWRLKGLDEPLELVELSAPSALAAPPEGSTKAYRVVLRDGLWVPVGALPGNLAPELDEFIGRTQDLRTLVGLFDGGARLVTLIGPGGIGKTRLAQRYARSWRGDFPGGVWFCDLAPARGVDGIVNAVALALGVPLGRSDPVQQLGAAIAARADCLLILDNFEQLTVHARATVGAWLRAAPQARLLVTSRELLALTGEHLVTLEPMAVGEAARLFADRVHAAGVHDPLDEIAVSKLVRLLDCLPLAVELAAARASVLTPAEQLRRIGERFRLLTARRGQPDRHATLRATIDWSWELLSPAERHALAQLSVFEGGFTLVAAEAVLDVSAVAPGVWVADLLQALLEKSLMRRTSLKSRWDLLRSVRDYAAEKLTEIGGDAPARHWQHFASLTEAEAIAERCVEIDNLVAACRRATTAGLAVPIDAVPLLAAARTLVTAWSALKLVGLFRVGLELATPLFGVSDLAAASRAGVLRVAGSAASLLGHLDDAAKLYLAGLDAASKAGDVAQQSLLQSMLGELEAQRGRLLEAEVLIERGLKVAGDAPLPRITALNALGGLALARSQPAQAERLYAQALECAQEHDDRRWIGGIHGSMGVALMAQGRATDARPHVEVAAHIAEEMADRQWASIARCNLGLLHHALGDHDAAAQQLRAVVGQAREMAHRRLQATALCNLGLVELARGESAAATVALQSGLELAEALQSTRLALQCRAYMAQAQVAQGEAGAALVRLEQAEAAAGDGLDDGLRVLLFAQRALALVAMGRNDAARLVLEDAAELAARSDAVDSEAREALKSAQAEISRHGPRCPDPPRRNVSPPH